MKNKQKLVIQMVSREFGVPPEIITSRVRTQLAAQARHVAVYIMHTQSMGTARDIARSVGKCDHGTTLHGYKVVQDRMDTEPKFRAKVSKLEAAVKACVKDCELTAEHVNIVAGCNVAGRIKVAIEAIKNPKQAVRPAVAELLDLLKFVNNPQPKLHVIIEVTGGVAYVTSCPDCVEATIIDHDNH